MVGNTSLRRKIWETFIGYLFLSPVIIIKTLFTFAPFIFVIYMSFFAFDSVHMTQPSTWKPVGLRNYVYFLVPASSRVETGQLNVTATWEGKTITVNGKIGSKDVVGTLTSSVPAGEKITLTFTGSVSSDPQNFGTMSVFIRSNNDNLPDTNISGTLNVGKREYILNNSSIEDNYIALAGKYGEDIGFDLAGVVNADRPAIGGVHVSSGAELFYKSLWFTVKYVLFEVPILLIVALFVAILLWGKLKYLDLYRTGIFFSYVTPAVATAMMWKAMFYKDGFFNHVLQSMHLPVPGIETAAGHVTMAWYQVMPWAFWTLIIYSVWKGLGFNSLVFLAGLINIPEELMEAARVDGANEWQVFKSIVLPLLSPTIFFLTMINLIGAFKIFSPILVLTGGGPNNETTSMVYLVYQLGFQDFDFGKAASVSVVLFVIIFAVSLLQKYLGDKIVFYAGEKR